MNIEDNRIAVLALDAVAIASLGVIALWQIGVLKKLPAPRSTFLDSERVNGSAEAYKWGVPDAFLGLASYAVTVALAAAGPRERWRKRPWLPLTMAGKAVLDAVQAIRMTRRSWKIFHAFSFWSLIVVGATVAAAPLVIPEASAATRVLSHGQL